ncbi:sugar ABC transporter ATP-binding protein [Herbiconiux sp. P16]|uniref:sugar ABC transporter ATP-binding protein n=1 Tax=Herbiconiux wuyangfengii TaxID=3342794 RepID=UPI0035B77E7F
MTEESLLVIRGLTKHFGAVAALSGLDLDVRAGEVHALIGQNGSGKSTLIKSLAGYHHPDGGEIRLHGSPLELPLTQGQLADAGLAFLHQDAPVAPAMTVLENIRLGRYRARLLGRISPRRERTRVRALLASVGVDVDPDMNAGRMPTAERALLGFAAALDSLPAKGGVLVLDEPTASLPPGAAELLFDAIRRVTAAGSGVLFISHRLDEVMEISDRVSVLRDGVRVGTVDTADTSEEALVSLMLGRDLDEVYPEREDGAADDAELVLDARGITGRLVQNVDVSVRAGEIVGVTGLVGMGQDELPYLLYGALPMRAGSVRVHGSELPGVSPRRLRSHRISLVPADRARASGAPAASVMENMSLPVLDHFFTGGFLRRRAEAERARELVTRFDVRPADPAKSLSALSGGNQQKVLLAKWLQLETAAILLHEPTLGVDIASRAQIFSIIREAADGGTGVLIASSEYEDLANLCDRVLVLNRGKVVAELAGSGLSEERILHHCFIAAEPRSSSAA